MPYKIAGFVEEDKVPRNRTPQREDTAEIVAQLIAAADEGNTAFAFIPVPDKEDRRRLANTLRNQVKGRGYDYEKVGGTKIRKLKSGQQELLEGIYVRAIVRQQEEVQPVKRRRNGTG